MLLYYTQVQVKETFTSKQLIHMFIYWMQNTKNKMNHFDYDNSYHYTLENNHKRFEIKNYDDKNILGIQFITDHNYKKNQFTIEVLYSYKQNTIDLAFYKEISNQSRYIPKLSIPKIFYDILRNENILKDNDLKIQEKPHFISQRHLNNILSKQFHLPLIILYREEKCCINPVVLNQEIYGMAHVLVIYSKTKLDTIDIIYPNNEKETIIYNHTSLQKDILKRIRNYMIQENAFYSFDELKRLELLQAQQENTISSSQVQELFLEEIEIIKNEIDDLQHIYENKKAEYQELIKKNEEYNQLVNRYNEDILISIHEDNYKEYQEIILSVIDKNLKNLPPDKVYRRKDLLKSIERKQKK